MKNKRKIFCLILVFMLISTGCVKRRIDTLEKRKTQRIIEKGGFDAKSSVFYPDNIDQFDMDEYLAWYKDLSQPPKLQLLDPESPRPLSNKEMIEDFNFCFNELKENYPFFGVLKREYNFDFIGNYNKYLKRVKESKTDQEFIDVMTGIMGDLNNHHARIADKDYVESTLLSYAKNWNSPSIYYEFLNLNKQAARNRYDIEGIQSFPSTSDISKKSVGLLPKEKGPNMTVDTSKESIAIVKINQMLDLDKIKEDQEVLDNLLRNKHLYKAIIIDIRENYGGNMDYWQKFLLPKLLTNQKSVTNHLFFKDSDEAKLILADDTINVQTLANVDISGVKLDNADDLKNFDYYIRETITISPDESNKDYGFEGNLYLLVDKNVFSAAEGMASFMKHSDTATLVGEQTGGDGITLGIINNVMPNSGLVFTYTNTLGYAPDGTIDQETRTLPDVQAGSYRNSIEAIEEIEAGNF